MVERFESSEESIDVVLGSGENIKCDLVVLVIGVKPNSEIAKNAGLELNSRGGIIVNKHLKTSDDNIYAVGDVIEIDDYVDKSKTMIPLAGSANKQGRICANNIAGRNEEYNGTLGTSIVKVFELTVAFTGWNEKS